MPKNPAPKAKEQTGKAKKRADPEAAGEEKKMPAKKVPAKDTSAVKKVAVKVKAKVAAKPGAAAKKSATTAKKTAPAPKKAVAAAKKPKDEAKTSKPGKKVAPKKAVTKAKPASPAGPTPTVAPGKAEIVTGVKKGKAMVDSKMPTANSYHVYEAGGKVYNASLMWSDVKANNNKFYLIQLLQSDQNPGSFLVWNRWGRVGYDGQHAEFRCPSPENGIKTYQKKFDEKVGKGYTEIEISYDEEEAKAAPAKKDGPQVESKLDKHVQDLVGMLFNMNLMKQQMVEIGYDAKKMPLGKLSKETIKRGYEVLKQISDVLDGNEKGDLADLSSQFYTLIPHNFGFKYNNSFIFARHMSLFTIKDKETLKAKLEMVQSLGDIEIATRLIEEKGKEGVAEIDSNYEKLHCTITTLDRSVSVSVGCG